VERNITTVIFLRLNRQAITDLFNEITAAPATPLTKFLLDIDMCYYFGLMKFTVDFIPIRLELPELGALLITHRIKRLK